MADEDTITRLELEQLADKLEQIDFTDKERALLVGVIAAAGAAEAPEVEGFAIPPAAPVKSTSEVAYREDTSFRSAFAGSMQPGKKFYSNGGTRSIITIGG